MHSCLYCRRGILTVRASWRLRLGSSLAYSWAGCALPCACRVCDRGCLWRFIGPGKFPALFACLPSIVRSLALAARSLHSTCCASGITYCPTQGGHVLLPPRARKRACGSRRNLRLSSTAILTHLKSPLVLPAPDYFGGWYRRLRGPGAYFVYLAGACHLVGVNCSRGL